MPAPRLARAAVPFIFVGLAALLVFALIATRPDTTPAPAEERRWPIEVVAVDRGAYAPILRLQGFIESPRAATLRAAVEGDVDEVPVREGDLVAAGDGLVLLEREELELVLRERRAEVSDLEAQLALERQRIAADREDLRSEERLLAIAEREIERVENLATEAFTSQADLDQARRGLEQQLLAVNARRLAVAGADARLEQMQARLDRAQALAARAQLDLDRGTIRAPFAGRVAEVRVAPGDRVAPGETVLSLYDTDALEIRATVMSSHVPRVRMALRTGALNAVADVDGSRVTVHLDRLAGRSDPGQGGVDALFSVEPGADLLLGRFASLELELPPEPDSFLLPFEALYETNRIYRVREDDQVMEAVAIRRVGEARMADGRRGVLVQAPGLENGERVVTTQLPQAMEGLRVRVVDPGPDA